MSEIVSAQNLLSEGNRAYRSGKHAEAAGLFSQAARAFEAEGKSIEAAEADNNASVAHLQSGDARAALDAAKGTEEVFAAANDTRRQGMALSNQAAALESLNRLDDALERYNRAAELLKQSGDSEMRGLVLKNISTLQLRTGKQFQALASMDAALDQQKRLSFRERMLQKLLRIPLDMLKRR